MSSHKTIEEQIIEKHTANLHRGYHLRAERIIPASPALGDYRWTDELILSTYYQAEHGRPPQNGLEFRVGNSGGGFDLLDFNFLPEEQWLPHLNIARTGITKTGSSERRIPAVNPYLSSFKRAPVTS